MTKKLRREDYRALRPAEKRPSCVVALDLRVAGRAGAVAVDHHGRARAWALIEGSGPAEELARHVVEGLAIRVRELRVLLGRDAAEVTVDAGTDEPPDTRRIDEILLAEGYSPTAGSAVAALRWSGGWWVGRTDERQTESLAGRLSERLAGSGALEPDFYADRLVLAHELGAAGGEAAVEDDEAGLHLLAWPEAGIEPVTRALPPLPSPYEAAGEAARSLAGVGIDGSVRVLGSRRRELCEGLVEQGFDAFEEPLPEHGGHGGEILPATLELAWRLAAGEPVPALTGPALAARRRGLTRARWTARAAVAIGAVGLLLFAAGLLSFMAGQARRGPLAAELATMRTQIDDFRATVGLAEEVRDLRTALAGHALPWPRLAPTLVVLALERPARVGWERLEITDGNLVLEVSAAGPTPFAELERLRAVLARAPGVLNLAWDDPVAEAGGLGVRQIFRASLRQLPPRRPAQPRAGEARAGETRPPEAP